MAIVFVSKWRDCYDTVASLLRNDEPFFLARMGGSDTDAAAYYNSRRNLPTDEIYDDKLRAHHATVKRYNGYYDKAGKLAKFFGYCEDLLQAYEQSNELVLCNRNLLSWYFPSFVENAQNFRVLEEGRAFSAILERVQSNQTDVRCFPFHFVEELVRTEFTLFHCFSDGLEGKRVLVVSPFGRSIVANFPNRRGFFPGYRYPEFELSVVNTPITYAGLPDEFYLDDDWFQTADRLKNEVTNAEFDVALLACGTYAMPLGLHIRDKLRKKAIYVGGVLQLYFGIMGRRYQNEFFTKQMSVEKFIHPLEREDYLSHIELGPNAAREAFGAYF